MTEASDSAPHSRSRLVKIVLALAGGVLLAWLVVRTTMLSALLASDPEAAAALAPDHPAVIMALADAGIRRNEGAVSDAALRRAIEASAGDPMSEVPFLLAGAGALKAGDGERAEALLAEARRRDPRSRTTRFLLLEHYVRAGKAKDAAREMAVLSRLLPEARPLLIAGLARFVAQAPNRAAIAQVLRGDPAVRQGVLEHLAAAGASPDLILALAGDHRPAPGSKWPRAVPSGLVARGDVAEAYRLWRRFSGFPASTFPAGLFNGGFEDLPAPPPFNWKLASGSEGVAELSGGLRVRYPGRQRLELAAQLMQLAPGRYTLRFEAEGEDSERVPGLSWTISCLGSGRGLLALPVDAAPMLAQSNRGEFAVPQGCAAQWIRLIGLPRANAQLLDLKITNLEIADVQSANLETSRAADQ